MKVKTMSSCEIGRPKFRYGNPIQIGTLYVFRQPQWDFYGVASSTLLSRQVMFQNQIGQPYTPSGGAQLTKTLWHTSMTVGGRFGDPEKLFVRYVSLSIDPAKDVVDAGRFLRDVLVQFTISSRPFFEAHGFKCPGAGGLFSADTSVMSNGWPDAGNELRLADELGEIIEQSQPFSVILDPTQVEDAGANTTYTTAQGGVGINAHVYLDGLFNRAVL